MHKRDFLARLTGVGGALLASAPVSAQAPPTTPADARHDVRRYGAAGNGAKLDTGAIQAAIDACAKTGGTVRLPPGRYLTGSLRLRSGVILELEAGAVLLGSPRLEDYPSCIPALRSYTDNYTERSLIYGENLERVGIVGPGTIDGQGAAFKGPYKVRPYLVRLIDCRQVWVQEVTFRDSPMWVQHYLACDDVTIDGVKVFSRCNHNNDGIDIDGCHRVTISNCNISSGDDAIVLKSTLNRACRDVAVVNCVLSSACNAFKLGTESNGGFENITLANCTIYETRLAGLALELVDGGTLERVSVNNVTMREVNCPIFIRLGNRARPFTADGPKPGIGRLRQVSISNVQADKANRIGCSITGLPDHPAEQITLDNIRIEFVGGGDEADARRQPDELAEKYPEYSMFGALPAYAFYCRHVKGLTLNAVRFSTAQPDARPALLMDDAEDLEIGRFRASLPAGGPAMVLRNSREAFIHGCWAGTGPVFLRVEGERSDRIRLVANELSRAAQPVISSAEVKNGVVKMG